MAGDFIIYKKDAIARKLSPDSADADKEGYVKVIPDLKINIQPLGIEYQALNTTGESGKMYQGLTTRSGISQGMIIEVSGTTTVSGMRLKVLGVEDWQGPLGRIYKINLLKPGE